MKCWQIVVGIVVVVGFLATCVLLVVRRAIDHASQYDDSDDLY